MQPILFSRFPTGNESLVRSLFNVKMLLALLTGTGFRLFREQGVFLLQEMQRSPLWTTLLRFI